MARPNLPEKVWIRNPESSVEDPQTGNPRPTVPTPEPTPARLSQKPVVDVSSGDELRASQSTDVSQWTILVPRGTALTAASVITDEDGRVFQVSGAVADRPKHRPQFRTASLRLISDMQT